MKFVYLCILIIFYSIHSFSFTQSLSCEEALRRALLSIEISNIAKKLSDEDVYLRKFKYREWIGFFRYKTGQNATIAEDMNSATALAQIDSLLHLKNAHQIKEYFFPLFMKMTTYHSQFLGNEKHVSLLMERLFQSSGKETVRILSEIQVLKNKNIKNLKKMGAHFNEYRTLYSKLKSYTEMSEPVLMEMKIKADEVFNNFYNTELFTRQVLPEDVRKWYPHRLPDVSEIWKELERLDYGSIGERVKLRHELYSEMAAFLWKYSPTKTTMNAIEARIIAKVPIVKQSFIRTFFRTFKDTQSQRIYYPMIHEMDGIYLKTVSMSSTLDDVHMGKTLAKMNRMLFADEYNPEYIELLFEYMVSVNASSKDEFLITLSRRPDLIQTRDFMKRFLQEKISESKKYNIEVSSFQDIYDRLVKAEAEAKILGDLHPVSSPFLLQLFGNSVDAVALGTASYLGYLGVEYFTFDTEEGLIEITEEGEVELSLNLEALEIIADVLKENPDIVENW